jgi:hypothetical protein
MTETIMAQTVGQMTDPTVQMKEMKTGQIKALA